MRTHQWDSLPVEKLTDLLHDAHAIHADLPSACKDRNDIVIAHIRSLIQTAETEKRHHQLQEQWSAMHAVLDRSEKLAGRFEQQMDKLLSVVEQQGCLRRSSTVKRGT